MVFHWSLSDSKLPQIPRILIGILADLNNDVVLTVSIRSVLSKSSSPCPNPLVTVQRAAITTGIIVTSRSTVFPNHKQGWEVLSLCFLLILLSVRRDSKAHTFANSVLFVGYFYCPRLGDPFLSQNFWVGCQSHSPEHSGLSIYHLFVWSNLNFWHICQ